MSEPRIITRAERLARRNAGSPPSPPKQVAWHVKRPDGTRCKTCKPIVVPVRTLSPSTES